jgi:hypothetical protein
MEKGGERKMKSKAVTRVMAIALITFTVLALTLVSAPAVSAKTLKCDQIIYYNEWDEPGPNPNHPELEYWKGEITGAITGTCYFWETEKNYIVGKTEHFFEDFHIDLGDGWISGHDEGVWNFATFKFRANGWVTSASENYVYLIGSKFHEEGTTTNPDWGLPIIGIGTCFFGPPTGHASSYASLHVK